MTEPDATAEKLRPFGRLKIKPMLASWIGGAGVAPGAAILDDANIPTFEYPDAAARAFCAMWRYSRDLDALYETPALRHSADIEQIAAQRRSSHRAREARRTLLTEVQSSNFSRHMEFRRGNGDRARAKGKLSILRRKSAAR